MAFVLIGYPNVGKSSLFYRLTKQRVLISSLEGTTRDIIIGKTEKGVPILDIPGIDQKLNRNIPDSHSSLLIKDFASYFLQFLTKAIPDLDSLQGILLVFDVRFHPTEEDKIFYQQLVKFFYHVASHPIPVYVIVNKVDHEKLLNEGLKYYELGCEHLYQVSAREGFGMYNLEDMLNKSLLNKHEQTESSFASTASLPSLDSSDPTALNIAIVGRPNVGKSLLLNQLLGYDRMAVQDQAGTTRDSVLVYKQYKHLHLGIMDTAGIRKPSKIKEKLEKSAVSMSMKGVGTADVVILMCDIKQPLESQDLRIADKVFQYGKPLVIVLNKVDTVHVDKEDVKAWIRKRLKYVLSQGGHIPVVVISAKEKIGLEHLLNQCIQLARRSKTKIGTGVLNRFIQSLPLMSQQSGMPKVRYITQTSVQPQKFMVFVSHKDKVSTTYKRFLINQLRLKFFLEGFPIFLIIRES